MPKFDVNFSDKTPKRVDPHTWVTRLADVVLDGKLLYHLPVHTCQVCGKDGGWNPKYLRTEDLGECLPKES